MGLDVKVRPKDIKIDKSNRLHLYRIILLYHNTDSEYLRRTKHLLKQKNALFISSDKINQSKKKQHNINNNNNSSLFYGLKIA